MSSLPFDGEKLTCLLDQAGLDAIVATSRHNIRYLTGGYYDHFHARVTRAGSSQYLAAVGIPRGRYDAAFYVGTIGEKRQLAEMPVWISNVDLSGGTTVKTAEVAARQLKERVPASAKIGVELPFLSADSLLALQRELPHATIVDSTNLLHELRAIKSAAELETLRTVADTVAEAIAATFRAGRDNLTTAEMSAICEKEMTARGVEFLWSFTNAGPGYLRAPSSLLWESGRAMHLDCGGEIGDYLADICRMGHRGKPSTLASELHAECLEIQNEIRKFVRPGTPYAELARAGEEAMARSAHGSIGRFVAHGIGMVSHEQPMISHDSQRPLEAGMVLSIETEFLHPEVGHLKIEDVVAVTPAGYEGYGDLGREWQIV
ncbi:MAG TPA: Xaa-Pro peptidase family protein [Chloroflexota bacterium]|nr:Xaa-Pro peptidase family protein [Chloroflexota bacterium]